MGKANPLYCVALLAVNWSWRAGHPGGRAKVWFDDPQVYSLSMLGSGTSMLDGRGPASYPLFNPLTLGLGTHCLGQGAGVQARHPFRGCSASNGNQGSSFRGRYQPRYASQDLSAGSPQIRKVALDAALRCYPGDVDPGSRNPQPFHPTRGPIPPFHHISVWDLVVPMRRARRSLHNNIKPTRSAREARALGPHMWGG